MSIGNATAGPMSWDEIAAEMQTFKFTATSDNRYIWYSQQKKLPKKWPSVPQPKKVTTREYVDY